MLSAKQGTEMAKSKLLMYFNAGMGRLSGRAIKANKRLEKLAAKYEAEGLTKEAATARALNEMRDNPRQDWRAG
jgi:hypothetical protein